MLSVKTEAIIRTSRLYAGSQTHSLYDGAYYDSEVYEDNVLIHTVISEDGLPLLGLVFDYDDWDSEPMVLNEVYAARPDDAPFLESILQQNESDLYEIIQLTKRAAEMKVLKEKRELTHQMLRDMPVYIPGQGAVNAAAATALFLKSRPVKELPGLTTQLMHLKQSLEGGRLNFDLDLCLTLVCENRYWSIEAGPERLSLSAGHLSRPPRPAYSLNADHLHCHEEGRFSEHFIQSLLQAMNSPAELRLDLDLESEFTAPLFESNLEESGRLNWPAADSEAA